VSKAHVQRLQQTHVIVAFMPDPRRKHASEGPVAPVVVQRLADGCNLPAGFKRIREPGRGQAASNTTLATKTQKTIVLALQDASGEQESIAMLLQSFTLCQPIAKPFSTSMPTPTLVLWPGSSNRQRQATVRGQRGAGDIAGFIRAQEHGCNRPSRSGNPGRS
jgi:hypothetical protein